MASNTNTNQEYFPFVLKGLGCFLDLNESQTNETSSPENPRDVSHLQTRNYTVAVYPFHCPAISHGASTEEAARTATLTLAANDDETIEISELQELSDEECVRHYNRILGGDFPWEKLNRFVLKGKQIGDLMDKDVEEWNEIYEYYVNHREPIVRDADNIVKIRALVHDILLWGVVLDYWYNVQGIDGGWLGSSVMEQY